jgi:hypothetical protein
MVREIAMSRGKRKGIHLADGRTLYRIDYRVRPSEDHPEHGGESDGGILSIWVFGRSASLAAVRALHLLQVLPFEAASREIRYDDEITTPNEAMKIVVDQVELCGFSFYYQRRACRHGGRKLAVPW